VREGDTLQSIAQSQWGDASLWYLLADANGLTGSETLTAGMVLNVPSKVANLHNNTGTFKVYDAGKAIGDTGPTLPDPPPRAQGCGVMGTILAVVIGVVVAALTAGALAPLMGVTGTASSTIGLGMQILTGASSLGGGFAAIATTAAIGGAVGSVVSQGVLIAVGNQEHFSWKQVGLAALSAGVTAGAGNLGYGVNAAKDIGQAALYAGGRALVTQGLAVATGLQSHFDWKGIAASAIAGGVAWQVGDWLGESFIKANPFVSGVLTGTAGGVASAAVRGGSISKQLTGIVADAIGSTVGNMVAEKLAPDPATQTYGATFDADRQARVKMDVFAQARAANAAGSGSGWDEVDDFDPLPEGTLNQDDGPNQPLDDWRPRGYNENSKVVFRDGPMGSAADVIKVQRANGTIDSELQAPGRLDQIRRIAELERNLSEMKEVARLQLRVAEVQRASAQSEFRTAELNEALRFEPRISPIESNGSVMRDLLLGRPDLPWKDDPILSAVMTPPSVRVVDAVINGFGDIYASTVQKAVTGTAYNPYSGTILSPSQEFDARISAVTMLVPGPKVVGSAGASVGTVGARGFRANTADLVESEASALKRLAANNRAGSPAADLRNAYQQAKGQVDFAHIEADVRLNSAGKLQKAHGGHFSTSPLIDIIPGTESVGANGSMWAKINLKGPDGNWYLKTNNNGFSSLTPNTWSLAQAKGEMSQAFLGRTQLPNGNWMGSSGGVDFRFFAPTKNVPLWRGFPEYTP
jgi:hypothetical protein